MEMLYVRSQKGRKGGTAKGYRGQSAYFQDLKQIFKGHKVQFKNNLYNRHQVDILIEDLSEKPIRVYEVTNYAPDVWMSRPRARRYIKSLNSWKTVYSKIYRAIVISYPYSVDKIRGLRADKYGDKRTARAMF